MDFRPSITVVSRYYHLIVSGVDIIAAAFFGLIFLGEKISLLHFVALALSAVGAIFISQPGFIFGQKQQNLLGSFLALLSGFFQAASFICARKSAHISVAVLTFSSLLLAVFMSLMPPLLPMVHAAKWQIVVAEPWKAMSLVLILLVLSTLSIALPAAGATRCPAAVSATVFTSSCMVSGYVSQIIFFKEVPGILTLLGAASMLLSVVLMALPALPEKSPAMADGSAVTSLDDLSRGRSFDSFDSLGSFVASEVSFNSTLSTLRRRETFQMMEIAEQIGAAMPVASTWSLRKWKLLKTSWWSWCWCSIAEFMLSFDLLEQSPLLWDMKFNWRYLCAACLGREVLDGATRACITEQVAAPMAAHVTM